MLYQGDDNENKNKKKGDDGKTGMLDGDDAGDGEEKKRAKRLEEDKAFLETTFTEAKVLV